MTTNEQTAETAREPVLSPADRISEMLFGLLMALSFVGAVSVAETGREEIRPFFDNHIKGHLGSLRLRSRAFG